MRIPLRISLFKTGVHVASKRGVHVASRRGVHVASRRGFYVAYLVVRVVRGTHRVKVERLNAENGTALKKWYDNSLNYEVNAA